MCKICDNWKNTFRHDLIGLHGKSYQLVIGNEISSNPNSILYRTYAGMDDTIKSCEAIASILYCPFCGNKL